MGRLASSAALNEPLSASIVEVDFSVKATVKDSFSKNFGSPQDAAVEIRGTIIVSF